MKKLLIITNNLIFDSLRFRLNHTLPFFYEKFEVKIVAIVPILDIPPVEAIGSRAAQLKYLIKSTLKTLPNLPRILLKNEGNVTIIRRPIPDTPLDFIFQIINITLVAWIIKLKKIYKEGDICLASPIDAGVCALFAKMPIPVIFEDVDRFEFFQSNFLVKKFVIFFERYCIVNSTKVISAGFKLAESAKTMRKNGVYCIPNGVDLRFFANIHLDDYERDFFSMIFIGTIAPWSGLEVVLQSLPDIVSEFPQTKLIIVGKAYPGYISALKEMAKKLNVDAHVFFLGPKEYKELPSIISKCGIGMATFPNEELMRYAFTYKVIEYMAAGIPIIATAVGDTGEIVTKYNVGIIVENTPESVASGVKKLFRDRDYALMFAKNSRRFSEDFDLRNLAQREIEILLNTIIR